MPKGAPVRNHRIERQRMPGTGDGIMLEETGWATALWRTKILFNRVTSEIVG
jgi:hypothetical protein